MSHHTLMTFPVIGTLALWIFVWVRLLVFAADHSAQND